MRGRAAIRRSHPGAEPGRGDCEAGPSEPAFDLLEGEEEREEVELWLSHNSF
jgi:hypothetical protein